VTPAPLSCGCRAVPRRRCDLCAAAASPFVVCGSRCLDRHLQERHPGAESSRARAITFQREVNRLGTGARTTYEGHRERLMRLVSAAQRGPAICVLGAGNGNDLDLPLLARLFGEVHLIDVDEEALEHAVAGLPPAVRARVTLHGGVDLSGCLDLIDDWSDGVPGDEALAARADEAAAALARRLGRTFDLVLSACLLSQLCHPLQNTLALAAPDWRRLFTTVTRVHLGTLAQLTRPGGTGVIACDVLCHAGQAIDAVQARVGRASLGEALIAALERGGLAPEPDPRALARLLEGSPYDRLVDRVFVTEPWAWDLGATMQVVYGVVFRRTEAV
jgi:hypothetical protein